MINQPQFTQFSGEGVFTSGNYQIEMRFTVQRQFSHIVFVAQGDDPRNDLYHQFTEREPWSLSGQLEDGRPILADQLILTKIGSSEGDAEFSPLADVIIGQSNPSPLVDARYPLVGMFDGKFSVEDSGWTIRVFDSEENAGRAENLSKLWGIPLEGLTLSLAKSQTTLDEYHEKARDIMLLLSLAVGNGVTSHRQIADGGSRGTMEVWRRFTGDEIGPGEIVPTFRLGRFLEQVLPVWGQWKPDTRSDARLAVNYINLSGTGYLDTRLFQITQAWEFLAAAWMPKGKLNTLESDLRKRIKYSYREWKRDYPEADPKGYWGKRITFPFEWPAAKRQIESLAESGRVDLAKVGLDLELLKEARDNVAHTGKMTDKMRTDRHGTYQLLAAAQFGLQLLLLAKLGYSDLVVTANKGWKSYEQIETFLKEAK
ncbi:MAG: hypothetical protein ABSH06_26085 [Thermodesulfobacteriota bacterium]